MDIKETARALNNTADTAEKKPYGFALLSMLLSAAAVYWICTGYINTSNERAEKCETRTEVMVNNMLELQTENRLLREHLRDFQDMAAAADTTIRQRTRRSATKILSR